MNGFASVEQLGDTVLQSLSWTTSERLQKKLAICYSFYIWSYWDAVQDIYFSGWVQLQICQCIFGYFLLWRILYSIGYVVISSEVECIRYMVDPRGLYKGMVDPREFASIIEIKSWTSVFRMFVTAEKKGVPHNVVITATPTFELLQGGFIVKFTKLPEKKPQLNHSKHDRHKQMPKLSMKSSKLLLQ